MFSTVLITAKIGSSDENKQISNALLSLACLSAWQSTAHDLTTAGPPVFALFHAKGKSWLLSLLHGGHTPGPWGAPEQHKGPERNLQREREFYLLIYLLKTFSICFCWNLPLITSWLLPSIEPLNEKKKINYLICRCEALKQIRNKKQDKDRFFKKSTAAIVLQGKKCKILRYLELLPTESFAQTPPSPACPFPWTFPLYLLIKMFSPLSPSTALKCREQKPHVPAHLYRSNPKNVVFNQYHTPQEPYLVPNSANKNARRCFGWRCNLKINKEMFNLPPSEKFGIYTGLEG